MMREILFRGKRKDNGEWLEGNLRQDKDTGASYISGWNYYTDCAGLEQLHDMLCPDYVPDWKDDRLKFYVYFDHEQGSLNITASSFCDALSLVTFETRENAEKAAEILNKEMRESK